MGSSHQDSGSSTHRYQSRAPYACRTRLASIDFPKFNGENVNQRIYQYKMYFTIDLTLWGIQSVVSSSVF